MSRNASLNCTRSGWINNLAALIQILSIIAVIITILVMSPRRSSAYDVFVSTNNDTGFGFAYVCLIGILPTLFSFSGFDAAGQLSEETKNASKKAPLAIIGTCGLAALIGFVYLLSLMFATGDLTGLTQNQSNPSATVQIFQMSTSPAVSLIFTILLIINLFFAGMSSTTACSRITYAMARNRVFPYSERLAMIFKRTQSPILCVFLVCTINTLLLLLQLGSQTAFAAIVSISTIGFQLSYMLPIVFRVSTARKSFTPGYVRLDRFSVLIGCVSVIWLLVTCIILLFPFNYPVTATNMNWTIVVITGIATLAASYWFITARKSLVDPQKIDVDQTIAVSDVILTRF